MKHALNAVMIFDNLTEDLLAGKNEWPGPPVDPVLLEKIKNMREIIKNLQQELEKYRFRSSDLPVHLAKALE